MNGKDRILNTIKGESKDRIPFVPTLSLLSSKLTGNSLYNHYTDPKAYVDGQMAAAEAFNLDCVISPLFFGNIGEAHGGTLKHFENQAPNMVKYPASTPREHLDLKTIDYDNNSSIQYTRDIVRMNSERSNNEILSCAIVLNPVDIPTVTMGIDKWMETILFDNDLLDEIFEKNIREFVKWGNMLLEDGADFLLCSAGFLCSNIVPRYLVEEKLLKVVEKAFSQINGIILLHNTGSTILRNMDLYSKLPNVFGMFADTKDDLDIAYESIKNEQLIVSGLDGMMINILNKDLAYKQTLQYIDKAPNKDKFIFGTSAADVNLDTPIENIKAMHKAIVDYSNGERYEK